MTPERFRKVEEILHAALSRHESERAAFLLRACAGNETLRREVQSLLAEHTSSGSFLTDHAATAAAHIIANTEAPSLTGRLLGVYQVCECIGVGGMGEVYRARDTKLCRDVALKILPALFTSDPARLARFEREARVLASLNHPHIGAIYGLEDSDGVRALVLELVDGDTLDDRIARGPIPVNEALIIARQIADALEAAHEKGIVHRDLKPANIKLTPDGIVKVLDFGLAKPTAGDELTHLTAAGTREGALLGTAAYMSPEQARGRTADKRADVWAFGVVLFEMLTGRPAFEGETISEVLAKVIEREPHWAVLPASTPRGLQELLGRCLRKDPKTRLQAIGDARIQIDELIDGATETVTTATEPPSRKLNPRYAWIAAALLLATIVALAAPATLYLRRDSPPPLLTRFEIPTPPTSDPVSFALSADGRQLAFVATSEGAPRLWLRPLDQVAAQPLTGTEGASYPFWAPDGSAIGFFAGGKLKKIRLGSSAAQELADAPSGRGGTWNQDDVVVFAPDGSGGLMRVMATGGTPTAVTRIAPGSHRWPQFLPDGRQFLFYGGTGAGNAAAMYAGALDGREPKRVLTVSTAAVYAPPGALLWVKDGVLVAQPFDAARTVLTDEPIPVAHGVGVDDGTYRGAFAISATGVLAHRASRGERRQLTWIDRLGNAQGTVGPTDENALSSPELAPDGQRVTVHRTVQGNTDIWLIDTFRDGSRRFTTAASLETDAVWSPDGERVVFASLRNGRSDLFEKAASGMSDEQRLPLAGEAKLALDWSQDGQLLLYSARDPKTGFDLWIFPRGKDGKPVPVVQTPFDERVGQFSPDGRWLAYQSNEIRPTQIHVQPFPGPGGPWQVSTDGGSSPRWGPDGKELFYVATDGRLMVVPISVGVNKQTFEAGAPVALFRTRFATGANIGSGVGGAKAQYTVASDGRRFLMNLSVDGATASPITIVLNWHTALKQ